MFLAWQHDPIGMVIKVKTNNSFTIPYIINLQNDIFLKLHDHDDMILQFILNDICRLIHKHNCKISFVVLVYFSTNIDY
jgi:hypothetical protein